MEQKHQFDVPSIPQGFVRIRPPKGGAHQRRWIVLACGDDTFGLCVVSADSAGRVTTVPMPHAMPYCDLFGALARNLSPKEKTWVIGFRMPYALAAAKWLAALECGEISLPQRKRKDGSRTRSGRISVSASCLDVDLVIGGKKCKLLDFANFGIEQPDTATDKSQGSIEWAVDALTEMIGASSKIGLSISKTTAAQVGYAKLRSTLADKLVLTCRDEESRKLERRAYFGGRNEAYFLGDYPGRVYSLDVRAFYAVVCRDVTLPTMLTREYRLGCTRETIIADDDTHWIADVIIRTTTPDYPVRWDGTTVYPVGEFATTLCWPELLHALHERHVVKIIRAASYACSPVLSDYASWYLSARDTMSKSNFAEMLPVLKCAFNSSLGYLARRKYTWTPLAIPGGPAWLVGRTVNPDERESTVQAHILDGECEWLRVGGEPAEAFPAIHATICSWGRIALARCIEVVGRANVLYVDTDGLLVNEAGEKKLRRDNGLCGTAPGQLVERWPSGACRINGQKNYQLGKHVVCAGLPVMGRTDLPATAEKKLTTGVLRTDGTVTPWHMECEDIGSEEARYVNYLVT